MSVCVYNFIVLVQASLEEIAFYCISGLFLYIDFHKLFERIISRFFIGSEIYSVF